MKTDIKVMPVIMSGGAGSRLWPASRQAMPKQLLPLVTEETMVQETAQRFSGDLFHSSVFICNAAHADPIRAQMADIGLNIGAIIVEPMGRNTAPCAVVAALHAQASDHPDALILLAPADHHVTKPEAFKRSVAAAIPAASSGRLVTFGIAPTGPETGYGYIHQGEAIGPGAFDVKAFKEKPDMVTAQRYLDMGGFHWNAGIFLFSPQTLLSEMTKFHPDIVAQARAAYKAAGISAGQYDLNADAFAACPSESIDYAVMEPTDKAAVVPCDIGWNDIGSFTSLHGLKQGENGNAISGDVIVHNTVNSLIETDGPLVTTVGVDGIAVIVKDGAVLVSKLDAAQDVKKIVQALKADGRVDKL